MSSFSRLLLLLGICLLAALLWNLSTGYVSLPLQSFLDAEDGLHAVALLRVNRVWAMALAGLAMPLSGFLLQEFFQNPLAGPSVLGITSVSSLAAALAIFVFGGMMLPAALQSGMMTIFGLGGSLVLLVVLLAVSRRFQNHSYLIVFGFLISAFCGAVISLLQLYAENQQLKNYLMWSFAGTPTLTSGQLQLLTVLIAGGVAVAVGAIRPLIGSMLGTQRAQAFGVDEKKLGWLVILSSSLLAASITTFLGPVLFVGIVIPHLARLLWNPARLWHLAVLCCLLGILAMELLSAISETLAIPVNVLCSVLGIPVIFLMLWKQQKKFLA